MKIGYTGSAGQKQMVDGLALSHGELRMEDRL